MLVAVEKGIDGRARASGRPVLAGHEAIERTTRPFPEATLATLVLRIHVVRSRRVVPMLRAPG